MITITFQTGTLVLKGETTLGTFDERIKQRRLEAMDYRSTIKTLQKDGTTFDDQACQYEQLPQLKLKKPISPRKHQTEALDAFAKNGGKGVVCLPTGMGKTILAVLAIAKVKHSTLVVVPTIDLLNQWYGVLSEYLEGYPIGRLGGGFKEDAPIVVATYDSARLSIESKGNRFGFLVCDECHHLPSKENQMIGRCSIAPFRLGLSATVERSDGGEELAYELLGSKVFEAQISEVAGDVLAPYEVQTIEVSLSPKERESYDFHRNVYTSFLRKQGIRMSSLDGWQNFIIRASRSKEGKEAMRSYYLQKRLAQGAQGKIEAIWDILVTNPEASILVFTDSNDLAYAIGERFFLGVITHKTAPKERVKLLDAFREGTLKVLVTSKVLNEGVDVPKASIGIVVSGTGTVREHVQRLGRILRQASGKRAIMFEIIAQGTGEQQVNERRKQHDAYQKRYEV